MKRGILALFILVFFTFIIPFSLAITEWPMYGLNTNNTFWDGTNFSIINGLNREIFTQFQGYNEGGNLTIANGYVYSTAGGERIYQLNASNVSQIISSTTNLGAIYNTVAYTDNYIYVPSHDGNLLQLNSSNISQTISYYSVGQIKSSPAVANGYVYIGTMGDIYQLNASNVSQLISAYIPGAFVYSTPAVANGYVYAGSYNGNLYQLNASNISQLISNYTTGGVIHSSPVISNEYLYVGSYDNNTYQLNASNVSQLISNYTTGNFIYSSPAVANGYVYIGSRDNNLYQLNASNVSQLISNYTTGDWIVSSPTTAKGYVYIGGVDGNFYQFNASNVSQPANIYDTGFPIYSSPAVANGYVYFGVTGSKRLYQLNASNISLGNTYPVAREPDLTLNSPENYANFTSYSITFNVTAWAELNLTNVSLWGNWTGSFIVNETNSSGINNSEYLFTKNLTSYGEGTYAWRVQAINNQTSSKNSSIRYFTIDAAGPLITFVGINDWENSSDTGLDINYVVSDTLVGLDSCWYTNDSSFINTTISCNTNLTTLNWSEGIHNITIWANDTLGNENQSTINFIIDTIYPSIIILSPNEYINSSDLGLDINYTVADNYLDSCWYANDSKYLNTSISCNTNLTTLNWEEGIHNVTIWVNDSAGNENQSIVKFRVDATPPFVGVVSPSNWENTSDTGLDIRFTSSGIHLTNCWYTNDSSGINTSITCNTNLTTLNWSEGQHNLTIWANDSTGNENQTTINFNIDLTGPLITIINPSDNVNSSDTSLDINYTTSDSPSGLNSCWYSNDTMSVNTSVACSSNLTTLNWSEGSHNLTIWANDSAGNENQTSVSFRIDTTGPVVTVIYPSNGTNSSNTLLDLNYTVLDVGAGVDSCWYSNNTYSVNHTMSCGDNLTSVNWSDMTSHNVTIWANDSAGNENKSIVFFTINSTDLNSPNVTLINPSNDESYTSNSQEIIFNFSINEKNLINNCSLILNEVVNSTNSSVNKLVNQSFTKILASGSYTWYVNCTDENGNVGIGTERSLTITAPTTTTDTGGGGGGSVTTTIPTVKEEKLQEGYDKQLNEGNKIKLEFARQGSKILEIVSVEENSVEVSINSINITITNGTTEKIDVNSDGFYDLEVSVQEITGSSSSKLMFKEIYEEIPSQEEDAVEEEVLETNDNLGSGIELPEEPNRIPWWIYAILAALIGITVGLYLAHRGHKHHKNH